MKRATLAIATAALALAILVPSAQAAFGLKGLDLAFAESDGLAATQAGSHTFAMTNELAVNTFNDPVLSFESPDGDLRNLKISFPPGLVADRDATSRCSGLDFAAEKCPDASAVGTIDAEVGEPGAFQHVLIYNLAPPPGVVVKFGFSVLQTPVTFNVGLNQSPPYNGIAQFTNVLQVLPFYSAKATIWGTPADPAHDAERGGPANSAERPLITLPRSCTGPMPTAFEASSWQGSSFAQTILSHGDSPEPLGMINCGKLGFGPRIAAQPTNNSAESPSGLDFDLDVANPGLANPTGIADSDIQKAVVTLPEGVTINPSQAEGLGACSEEELALETADSAPGDGCPPSAKVGTVEVESPLAEGEILKGALYVAKPYENRFGSLIALYMTIKDPGLGIAINLAGKVEPDPATGQLITTFDQLPQLPFSHFHLHFREGGRSPLVTPPTCGTYTTDASFTPWANPDSTYSTTSEFTIDSGPGGGPCPAGGTPPFTPGFSAGTTNNRGGSYSPFYMRLTRPDGNQDLTRFSAKLPPGMVAKLAGTSECSDSSIAAAKAKSGMQELAFPSCPDSSQIGHVLSGVGVGPELLYVPGKIYLSGPLNGAPLSVVAIVPAVAGPFDVGTVVVRQALQIDPRHGQARVDGSRSDPLPHILAGIPLKVRDIRVYVDKPNFTLNPTSCDPFAVGAELWGGGADVFSSADDSPTSLSARFQAADCSRLGFAPSLSLTLKGGTRRGAHPVLNGVFKPRPGDANLAGLVVRLPRSAFLDQAHIRTICTRVQFAAKNCPAGAVYGHATAYTPILDQPLEGPVYLRSSDHNLPDFVAALHGLVDVEAVARLDSKHGGIRASFEEVPDAPLTKVVVSMQGGKKGLIVNSTNLCDAKHRADLRMSGHNGKRQHSSPLVRATSC